MKIESTDVVGGRCVRGNNVTLYPNEKDRAMNEIKLQILYKDQFKVIREDMMESFKHMKIGKAPGPSEDYA